MQVYAPRDPLSEFLTGGITFRQLRVMVDGLARNPSTPIGRAINGPWDDTNNLLNSVIWELRVLTAAFVNSKLAPEKPRAEPQELTWPEPTAYQSAASSQSRQASKQQRTAEDQLLAVLARSNEGETHGR